MNSWYLRLADVFFLGEHDISAMAKAAKAATDASMLRLILKRVSNFFIETL